MTELFSYTSIFFLVLQLFFDMVVVVNEKNKGKRKSAKLDRKAHRKIKIMASKSDRKFEEVLDEVVFNGLKCTPIELP